MKLEKMKRERNKMKKCCDCGAEVEVKYNRSKGKLSEKNSVWYWTRKGRKDRYKCDKCWLSLYYFEPQKWSEMFIPDPIIRIVFNNYVRGGFFGKTDKLKKKKKQLAQVKTKK